MQGQRSVNVTGGRGQGLANLEGSNVTVRVNWREVMNVIIGRCKG